MRPGLARKPVESGDYQQKMNGRRQFGALTVVAIRGAISLIRRVSTAMTKDRLIPNQSGDTLKVQAPLACWTARVRCLNGRRPARAKGVISSRVVPGTTKGAAFVGLQRGTGGRTISNISSLASVWYAKSDHGEFIVVTCKSPGVIPIIYAPLKRGAFDSGDAVNG